MLTQAQVRTVSAGRPDVNSAHRSVPTRGNFGAMELMGSQMTFGPNEGIFVKNEPAEYVYKVVKGAVRTYKILSDGRRQIGGFYLPGDVFGLEVGNAHQFSAEAINYATVMVIRYATVMVIRRGAVVSPAEGDCQAARELWNFTGRELHRVQEHMMLLVKSAQQRVACFLLEMSERLAATDAIELPMSRQDIADYLGLTIETVSRTMTQLASAMPSGCQARVKSYCVIAAPCVS
jgi:CRP/FNR family transcriptional regulator, nitrogen fixation regulation protein